MQALTNQAAALGIVLAAFLIGPFIALAFVSLRKRGARASRRSPMNTTLLRSPGHTLREQLDDANLTVPGHLMMVIFVPVTLLALGFAQNHFSGSQHSTFVLLSYSAIAIGFVAVMIFKLWKIGERLDRLKAGFDAELAVGQKLGQLMR